MVATTMNIRMSIPAAVIAALLCSSYFPRAHASLRLNRSHRNAKQQQHEAGAYYGPTPKLPDQVSSDEARAGGDDPQQDQGLVHRFFRPDESVYQPPQAPARHNQALVPQEVTIREYYTNVTCPSGIRFKDPRMRLCWADDAHHNFGDDLGPSVVDAILMQHFQSSNLTCVRTFTKAYSKARRKGEVCLAALGSIMQWLQDYDHVWGTGFNPSHVGNDYDLPILTYHSVRGPLTRQFVAQHGAGVDETAVQALPMGDPGFLVPYFFANFTKNKERTTGTMSCFIKHMFDDEYATPAGAEMTISVHDPWSTVINRIRECDLVASTSLHGIILADTLGIPTLWFRYADSKTIQTEGNFKYMDYLQSTGRTDIDGPEIDPTLVGQADAYMQPLPASERARIAAFFVSSFPFHLFELAPEN